MLERPPRSPAAIRARRWRAQRKAGIREARIRVHARRLAAALRKSNPQAGELETWPEVEAELTAMLEAFIDRWLGKNPNA
jgi:hypothetical protein